MALAYVGVPYEQVFKVAASSAATFTAEVHEVNDGGVANKVSDVVMNTITIGTTNIGYLFSYTFNTQGVYIVSVEVSGVLQFDSVTVTNVSLSSSAIHAALDSYPDKARYHADTSNLLSQDNMMDFAKANYLHYAPEDTKYTPANISGDDVSGSYVVPTGGNAGRRLYFDASDDRHLCGLKFYVGLLRNADGTGVVTPGTLHDTQIKFYVWRDTGSSGISKFGEVVWESETVSGSSGTFIDRDLIRDASDDDIPYTYNYVDRYLHTYSDLDDIILSGNYLVGWSVVGSNSVIISAYNRDPNIQSGYFYTTYSMSRTNEREDRYISYYGPYSQVQTFTTNDSRLDDLADASDSQTTALTDIKTTIDSGNIDANVVSVTGTDVTDVSDFKSDDKLDAIKLRIYNMPRS
ncbi:hypothetical protein NVP1031O_148 [Vibrio phage 1.031.O._10N.261.46.F8]|nr:hypothetical protein NVP1031O_148 [Vibrio phage 1.031.O._10N.261.46.F8]